MTNAELIQKIRNEIERLKGIGGIVPLDNREQKTGFESALIDIEIFLDSLESEKPMELEDEISRTYHDGSVTDTSDLDHVSYENIARHFAKWGAEHSGSSEIPNDLEEAAEKFARFYDQGTCDGIAQDCFIAGAEWQAEQLLKSSPLPEDTVLFNKGVEEGKRLAEEELSDLLTIAHLQGAEQMKEQMLKEAVGVQVVGEQRDLRLIDSTQRCLFNAKRGDWLKIIIVKEEENGKSD